MESLADSEWDIVIAGTGLHESLLALALSRSDKKILHVDKGEQYGGEAATVNLADAQSWALNVTRGESRIFTQATSVDHTNHDTAALGPPRRYNLALAPQLVYAKSSLISGLVSAKVDTQLEFLAMGNWWNCHAEKDELIKVPNSREDMFNDDLIDAKSKRSLIKFLRFAATFEQEEDTWRPYADTPFSTFLEQHFGIKGEIQEPLAALAMVLASTVDTQTEFCIRRIARHLRSLGVFGPNFAAVLPKYGGLAELTQAACRACAVGGATYILGHGVTKEAFDPTSSGFPVRLELSTDDKVSSKVVVYGEDNKPDATQAARSLTPVSHSIAVIGNPLTHLFPSLGEESPTPAGATVRVHLAADTAPVTVIVHTSDSGECPAGQCICYASILGPLSAQKVHLDAAIRLLLTRANAGPDREILWTLHYEKQCPEEIKPAEVSIAHNGRQIVFPAPSADLVFEDEVIERVKTAWLAIMGPEADERDFMKFERREGQEGEEDGV